MSDEIVRLDFTPEQREIFRASGIEKDSWRVEKHHLMALSLVASSSNLDTLSYGPSIVAQILKRTAGNSGALLEIILTPSQREELRRHTGSTFRSLTIAADDLSITCHEVWGEGAAFDLGRRFRVVPEASHSETDPGRQELRLPFVKAAASRVFGTGHHSTTVLAVELLEDYVRPRDRVLDFGTGSGILAVAAAKLGAREVLAIDQDRACVTIAESCAQINSLQSTISVLEADRPPEGSHFDLIVANVLPNILLPRKKELRAALAPRGTLIAGGFVIARGSEIAKEMSTSGFWLVEERIREDWQALVFGG